MRFVRSILFMSVVCLSGCTADRLRHHMVRQGATLPELEYQQVLDNLALFATNPDSLPWHVNLREGTSQVTDSASGGAAVELGPPPDWLPQLFGTRTVVAQWGGSPVVDPLELRLLRIAYRRAHGSAEMLSPELIDELSHELKGQVADTTDLRDESALFYEHLETLAKEPAHLSGIAATTNDESFVGSEGLKSPLARDVSRQVAHIENELSMIGTGWFCVGRKCDVPRGARYVGHYEGTWVWVPPEGYSTLTDFTLTAMKLSTLIKETQTLINPGSIKFSPGDRG